MRETRPDCRRPRSGSQFSSITRSIDFRLIPISGVTRRERQEGPKVAFGRTKQIWRRMQVVGACRRSARLGHDTPARAADVWSLAFPPAEGAPAAAGPGRAGDVRPSAINVSSARHNNSPSHTSRKLDDYFRREYHWQRSRLVDTYRPIVSLLFDDWSQSRDTGHWTKSVVCISSHT